MIGKQSFVGEAVEGRKEVRREGNFSVGTVSRKCCWEESFAAFIGRCSGSGTLLEGGAE